MVSSRDSLLIFILTGTHLLRIIYMGEIVFRDKLTISAHVVMVRFSKFCIHLLPY